MPRWDWACTACETVEEHTVLLEERDTFDPPCPHCGGKTQRQFGLTRNFVVYEAEYSEALDIDITGPQQKREALKAMNLIEAGDPVKGARNDDTKNPHRITGQKPKGRTLADWQRAQEKRQQIKEGFVVETTDAQGNTLDRKRSSEVRTLTPMSREEKKKKQHALNKMVGDTLS